MDSSRQGQAPFGFRWQGGKLHLLPGEAGTRLRAFQLFLEHKSMGATAKALNREKLPTRRGGQWSDVQVARILECPSAVGTYAVRAKSLDGRASGEERVECPPIVQREVWERAKKLLETRRKGPAGAKDDVPMAGLVQCACGRGMAYAAGTGRFSCPECATRITVEDLEAVFAEDFAGFIASHPSLSGALAARPEDRRLASEAAVLGAEAERLEREMAQAERAFAERGISLARLEELRRPLDAGRAEVSKKLAKLNGKGGCVPECLCPQAWADAWPALPQARRRRIISTFVGRFVVGDGEVEITYLLEEPSVPPKDESVPRQTSDPTYQPRPGDPVYVRLPKPGQKCPHTGLSRAKLNELILPNERNGQRPPVKSKCLRQEGAQRGIRLVMLDSLMAYLSGSGR